MYKCKNCGKKYKRKDHYDKHIIKCEVEIEEIKFNENELYLMKIFEKFNPSNIEVRNPVKDNLIKIYREDYNRKINCDCASEYVRMYCFLNQKTIEIRNG